MYKYHKCLEITCRINPRVVWTFVPHFLSQESLRAPPYKRLHRQNLFHHRITPTKESSFHESRISESCYQTDPIKLFSSLYKKDLLSSPLPPPPNHPTAVAAHSSPAVEVEQVLHIP